MNRIIVCVYVYVWGTRCPPRRENIEILLNLTSFRFFLKNSSTSFTFRQYFQFFSFALIKTTVRKCETQQRV